MTDAELYKRWLRTAPTLELQRRLELHRVIYGAAAHKRLCKILDRFGVVTS